MNVTLSSQNELKPFNQPETSSADQKTAIEIASHGALMPIPLVMRNNNGPITREIPQYQTRAKESEMSLYTNLTHSIVQIKGADRTSKLYNDQGKLLLIVTCKNHVAQFNTSHLKKGVYFIEANHNIFEFVK